MVHQEYKPQGDAHPDHKSRNILSRDQTNVFQREGRSATDKTVKIAESRAPGYGVSSFAYVVYYALLLPVFSEMHQAVYFEEIAPKLALHAIILTVVC